ncbi:hypothetical protein [Polluticoccus soli]|uniref:hypothetical protein n=1 Tax=Polluticoccus soli TaxID=3034150 RepID=UPI0023E09F1F|nr:hypothetical protein [Flavipsychrobacter sp. JY13-12]
MRNCLLIILLVLYTPLALAQKTRTQRCAPAESPRQKYIPLVSSYGDMEFGARKAFVYKYNGRLDEHYSFISHVVPYGCISFNQHLFGRFELYVAAEAYFNRPGIRFKYGTAREYMSETMWAGSIGGRALAGLSCNVVPGWKLTAAPALIFASTWEYAYSGSYGRMADPTVSGYSYKWGNEGFYDKLYAGLDLQTEHFIYRDIYFNAGVSFEFASLMPFQGEVEMDFVGADTRTFKADASPYLINANIGLSYRFGQTSNY